MTKVKSFSVGNGDMFYIKHNSDNFTIIDCYIKQENKDKIINELKEENKDIKVNRFISTHPDNDHILGIKCLDENYLITNFYYVDNSVNKEIETDDFNHYCELKKNSQLYLSKNCTRKWLNESGNDKYGNYIQDAGIKILWPDINNTHFKDELEKSSNYGNDNNICPIIKYSTTDDITFLWFGDLETEFLEKVENDIEWCEADIIFAPHHGRKSGALPKSILDKINPKIIIVGEADAEDLEYYKGYNTITQNSSGDIIFDCNGKEVDIYCSNNSYKVEYLKDLKKNKHENYIGTLEV